jgi:hypothetical protein
MTDYFRAADAESVVQALETLDGGPLVGTRNPAFDGVDAKGVDACVVLGKLIAAIQQVPWQVHLVEERMVWPFTPAPGPDDPEDENDPWAAGLSVTELGNAVRDALAGVPDADIPTVVTEWVQAEEFRGARIDDIEPLAEELIRLARRARDAGERLYCWTCV